MDRVRAYTRKSANRLYYQIDSRLKKSITEARNRAKKRNLEFDLDYDWLLDLYNKQNGCCKLTGIKIELTKRDGFHYAPYSPSLDRIDAKKGYTKDNTRLVCTAMNIALHEYGEEMFKKLVEAYLEQRKKNESSV